MTESGKFIELEGTDATDGRAPEPEAAVEKPEVEKEVSASPRYSPGKLVRIKENGATNGDKNDLVRLPDLFIFVLNALVSLLLRVQASPFS